MTAIATKIDYKKELKALYSAPRRPVIVEVPELNYLMIDGRGDPESSPTFQRAISALYGVSFTIKFALKSGGLDYSVMPLQGLWWTESSSDLLSAPKDQWSWTLMIMQPREVSEELVADAVAKAATKSPTEELHELRLEPLREGMSAQVLHIGPYEEERSTIESLHRFIAEGGFAPRGRHHEIYLGDPRRARPEKLRTLLRHPIEEV